MTSPLQSDLNHQEPLRENPPLAFASPSGLADSPSSHLLTPNAVQMLRSLPGWCSAFSKSLPCRTIPRAITMHTVHNLHNGLLPQVHWQHWDNIGFSAAENDHSLHKCPQQTSRSSSPYANRGLLTLAATSGIIPPSRDCSPSTRLAC